MRDARNWRAHLLGDQASRRAVLVDPVISTMGRDLEGLKRLCGVCPDDLPGSLTAYCG